MRLLRETRTIFFLSAIFAVLMAGQAGVFAATTTTRSPASQPNLPELSRFLPIWTQGYLEIRDLDRQMARLSWLIPLVDSEGNPQPVGSSKGSTTTRPNPPVRTVTEQFDRVVRNGLGLTGEEFLSGLLGRHFAIGWGGPAFRDQFGLVCRIKSIGMVGRMLTAAKAVADTPTTTSPEGRSPRVRKYRLSFGNLHAAVIDDQWLILATTGSFERASMFNNMVELASSHSDRSLRRNSLFASAVEPLNRDSGVIMVLLTNVYSQGYQRLFEGTLFGELQRNIQFISLTGEPHQTGLTLNMVVQPRWMDPAFLPDQPLQTDPLLRNMTGRNRDVAYLSSINPARWYRRIVELSNKGIVDARQYKAMFDIIIPDPQLQEKIVESLGPRMAVVISTDSVDLPIKTPTQPITSIPRVNPLPRIALIVGSTNPTVTFDTVDQVFKTLGAFMSLGNLTSNPAAPKVDFSEELYNGLRIHTLRIAPPLPLSAKMEVVWTMVEHYLVIANSPQMARQLIDQAFLPVAAAEGNSTAHRVPGEKEFNPHWTVRLCPTKAADFAYWANSAFTRIWKGAKGSHAAATGASSRVVLGIGTREVLDTKTGRSTVQVAAVLPGYPAWDKLRVGDTVVAVDDMPLDTNQPQRDLHTKTKVVVNQGRSLKFSILRNQQPAEVVIPAGRFTAAASPRAVGLLSRILTTLGKQFGQVNIECFYAPDGQIKLHSELEAIQPTDAISTTKSN